MTEMFRQQMFGAESNAAEDLYNKARERATGSLMFGATAIVQRTDKGARLTIRPNDPTGSRGSRNVVAE